MKQKTYLIDARIITNFTICFALGLNDSTQVLIINFICFLCNKCTLWVIDTTLLSTYINYLSCLHGKIHERNNSGEWKLILTHVAERSLMVQKALWNLYMAAHLRLKFLSELAYISKVQEKKDHQNIEIIYIP